MKFTKSYLVLKDARFVRYANRKLYDLQNSRYTTLEYVGRALLHNYKLTVVDAKSGTDITAQTFFKWLASTDGQSAVVFGDGFLQDLIVVRVCEFQQPQSGMLQ